MAFYTFIHGNPKCRSIIKYTGSSIGIGGPPSCNRCLHVNDFFYGLFNVDVQAVAAAGPNDKSVAVHWPVSQGTYLRGMRIDAGWGTAGIFGEAGSGGIISDCAITNGDYGMQFGNQQWTFRDVSIRGSRIVGIQVLWNWVFTFVGLSIADVPIGISWPLGAASLIIIDSNFTNIVE
eukprot:SAG31_NODE_14053_length_830_cov_0.749658_1_plen_176_part_01